VTLSGNLIVVMVLFWGERSTVSELKDISAFYATTTGEKTKMSPLIEAEI
jgi:hypothetical protein